MGRIKRTLVALVGASAAALAMSAPAHAGLLVESAKDCDDPSHAKVFRPWLDVANYVPAPGAHAESSSAWDLDGGARIVDGNEPWKVGSSKHDSSLLLPAGSSATTDAMCVGIGHPTMRFFAKRNSGTLLSTMKVEVLFNGLGGLVKKLPIGLVVAGQQWQPTLPYPVLASLLPLLPGQMTPVQFRFTPLAGNWQIDDVYVDPWRFR